MTTLPRIVALVLCICSANAAIAEPVPLSETSEAQAAFKALRTLETKIEVGMNLTDYRREVGTMAVEIGPLDEMLQARHADALRTQLATIRQRYTLASELWNACIQDRDNCLRQNMIDVNYQFPSIAAIVAKAALAELPSANQPKSSGGVLMPSGKQSFVGLERLLSALWADAKTKGQGLRADVAGGATADAAPVEHGSPMLK